MPYQQDTEYDLTNEGLENCRYIISSQHRNGNPNKSIWSLTHDGEIDCFIFSVNSNWVDEHTCFGVSVLGETIQVVGHNCDNDELKIAKFVDANANMLWHGYPADYMRNSQDRPATNILRDWVQKGYISKAKMSKIRLGQTCNL